MFLNIAILGLIIDALIICESTDFVFCRLCYFSGGSIYSFQESSSLGLLNLP